MKSHFAASAGLGIVLQLVSPGTTTADPVIVWNENAATAATSSRVARP